MTCHVLGQLKHLQEQRFELLQKVGASPGRTGKRQRNTEKKNLHRRSIDCISASQLTLAMNIWTGSALPWTHIDPAAVNHPGNRPVNG